MPFFTKQGLIFGKIQTAPGTYLESVAADWIEANDINLTPMDATEVDLPLLSPNFGAVQKMLTGLKVKLSFSTALAGSGTAGTAPYWGVLERICGMAQIAVATPASVQYKPANSAFELGSLVAYIGTNKHALRDARGTSKLEIARNGWFKRTYEITGVYVDPAVLAPPAVTVVPRIMPTILQPGNATLSLYGITNLCLHSMSLDTANDIKFTDFLNCTQQVQIVDRHCAGSIEFVAESIANKDWFAAAKAGLTGALSFSVGAVAGNKLQIDAPKVQLTKPSYGDVDGLRTLKFDMNIMPSTGSDDYTLTAF